MRPFNISVHAIEPSIFKTGLCDKTITKRDILQRWDVLDETTRKSYGEEYLHASRCSNFRSIKSHFIQKYTCTLKCRMELCSVAFSWIWQNASNSLALNFFGDRYKFSVSMPGIDNTAKMFCDQASDKVHLVPEAMVHALLAEYPQERYLVGAQAKWVYFPLLFFPIWVQVRSDLANVFF